MTGIVFDIKEFSLHDGPGIRTTVFFKGCPLRCVWCHNPEGIGFSEQIAYYENKCIGCGECTAHCPQSIDIPKEIRRIDKYIEDLKTDTLGI